MCQCINLLATYRAACQCIVSGVLCCNITDSLAQTNISRCYCCWEHRRHQTTRPWKWVECKIIWMWWCPGEKDELSHICSYSLCDHFGCLSIRYGSRCSCSRWDLEPLWPSLQVLFKVISSGRWWNSFWTGKLFLVPHWHWSQQPEETWKLGRMKYISNQNINFGQWQKGLNVSFTPNYWSLRLDGRN